MAKRLTLKYGHLGAGPRIHRFLIISPYFTEVADQIVKFSEYLISEETGRWNCIKVGISEYLLFHILCLFCVYFVYPFLRQKKFNYPLMAGHYHYYAKMSESSANPINLILILYVLARVFSLYDF